MRFPFKYAFKQKYYYFIPGLRVVLQFRNAVVTSDKFMNVYFQKKITIFMLSNVLNVNNISFSYIIFFYTKFIIGFKHLK